MPNVPKVRPGWLYNHFQAVGRAQTRYLLFLLLVSAYTVGLDFTNRKVVGGQIGGLLSFPAWNLGFLGVLLVCNARPCL